MKEDVTVKFVKNLRDGAGFYGICLFWIKEVHIDESFKTSKALKDLSKHEKYHYHLITKILKTKSRMKKGLLGLWNNIWDFLDTSRIFLKHAREFKIQATVHVLIYAVVFYVLIDILSRLRI